MNPRPASTDTVVEVDMRALFRSLVRAAPYVLVVLGIVGTATHLLLSRAAPLYKSEATVLIEAGKSDSIRPGGSIGSIASSVDPDAVANQIRAIRSRDVAIAVAKKLRLDTFPEFDPALNPSASLFDDVLMLVGLEKDPLASSVEDRVLEEFSQNLDAYAIDKSPVIAIDFSSRDPKLAADAANAVAAEFVDLQRASWRDANAEPAARFISKAAVATEPYFPRKVPMVAATTAAAALLLIAFILVRELASGRPMREIPLMGRSPIVPDAMPVDGQLRWADDHGVRRMMPAAPTLVPTVIDRVEESLKAIASEIMTSGAKRIIVTLAEGSDVKGRPLAAVALARALAKAELRPVLIDLRGDGANSLSMGEVKELPGFSDLLAGEASFAQAIFRDRRSRVHFIPAGLRPFPEDLTVERLDTILSALDLTYDYVILDAANDFIEVTGKSAGAAVVVSEFGAADPRSVKAFEQIEAASKGKILLLIVDPTQALPLAEESSTGAAA